VFTQACIQSQGRPSCLYSSHSFTSEDRSVHYDFSSHAAAINRPSPKTTGFSDSCDLVAGPGAPTYPYPQSSTWKKRGKLSLLLSQGCRGLKGGVEGAD
jgi:hypothetical protein